MSNETSVLKLREWLTDLTDSHRQQQEQNRVRKFTKVQRKIQHFDELAAPRCSTGSYEDFQIVGKASRSFDTTGLFPLQDDELTMDDFGDAPVAKPGDTVASTFSQDSSSVAEIEDSLGRIFIEEDQLDQGALGFPDDDSEEDCVLQPNFDKIFDDMVNTPPPMVQDIPAIQQETPSTVKTVANQFGGVARRSRVQTRQGEILQKLNECKPPMPTRCVVWEPTSSGYKKKVVLDYD